MRRTTLLLWSIIALTIVWVVVPDAVLAHEGQGFHPEALWSLLRTGLTVVAVMFGLGGMLWAYERVKSHKAE